VSGKGHSQKTPTRKTNCVIRSKDEGRRRKDLTVRDRRNEIRYLIDTGADISVLPKTATRDKHIINKYKLYAPNNTPITTYGTKLIQLDLGLRRRLDRTFIVADVKQAIIGAGLLAYYELVDLKRRLLQDGKASRKTNGIL